MPAGTFVEISVADTGHGMTPDVLAHMFEPFFTTKDVGRGTGLGLAMVYGTVKQSGGFIFVDSQPNAGSIFRLYFPPAASQFQPSDARANIPAPIHGITVLVVEDEPGVRGLVTAALRREGYLVLQAESGKAAIDAAAQAGRIDVLLTDIAMPGMSGIELATTLARTQSDMRVIVMSGHNVTGSRSGKFRGHPCLTKPVEIDDLMEIVHRFTGESRPRPNQKRRRA